MSASAAVPAGSGGNGGTMDAGAGGGLDPARLAGRKRLLKPAMRWMRDMYVAAATLIKAASAEPDGGAGAGDGSGAGTAAADADQSSGGAGAAAGALSGAGDTGAGAASANDQAGAGDVEADAGAGAGAGAGESDAGASAGVGAGAAVNREAVLEAAAAEFVHSEQCSLPRLRGAFFGIPEPVDETDTDLTLAALAPIIALLEKAPPDMKDAFFTLFHRAMLSLVRVEDQTAAQAVAATPAAIAGHLERVQTVKRMFEVREAMKSVQYKKRGVALRTIERLTEARAAEMQRQTAALKAAQRRFRGVKAGAKEQLGEANDTMRAHVAEMEERVGKAGDTMDARLAEHDKHLEMIRAADGATSVLVAAQASMLKHRICGLVLVDKLQCRRIVYTVVAAVIVAASVAVLLRM